MKRVTIYISIALGFLAPSYELTSRMCTAMFFDPLPSVLHALIFYLLPISMLVTMVILSRPFTLLSSRIAKVCIVYSFVVSIAYSIWFLPISWISVFGILALGLGILGLTPYLLLIGVILIYKTWRDWVPYEVDEVHKNRVGPSLLLVLPILIVLWWHPIVISVGEAQLESDSPDGQYTGLAVLRNFTSEQELRRHSFNINNRMLGTLVHDENVIREAYYYIYGTRPGISARGSGIMGSQRWEFDRDRGSMNIGKRQDGLSLKESALDAAVEARDGYAYTEWTLVFENSNVVAKEARAAVQLPANSVVSKASLWVDGEERDAAFGSTAKVRSAYRSVVRRRMDPLLVTMIGPDQVMVQCFPVPANGTMKIRLGITSPLRGGRMLGLPRLLETNYSVAENLQHAVWVEGDVRTQAIVAGRRSDGSAAGITMSNEELSRIDTYFEFDVEPPDEYSWSGGSLTLQSVPETEATNPPVLLIDGREDVLDLLREANWSGSDFSGALVAHPFGFSVWDKTMSLDEFLLRVREDGGVNPSPALHEAVRRAISYDASVVWLHGSLPADVRDELALEQLMRRAEHPVQITTLAVSGEVNSLISDLGSMRWFTPYEPTGDLLRDIRGAIARATKHCVYTEDQVPLGGRVNSGMAFTLKDDVEVTHPYRLYLYSQVMQEWYVSGAVDEELTARALETHLVTPVSGAVVLEDDSQYARANLDPSVGVENVPKIPEPEFYVLLAIALLGLVVVFWKRGLVLC